MKLNKLASILSITTTTLALSMSMAHEINAAPTVDLRNL